MPSIIADSYGYVAPGEWYSLSYHYIFPALYPPAGLEDKTISGKYLVHSVNHSISEKRYVVDVEVLAGKDPISTMVFYIEDALGSIGANGGIDRIFKEKPPAMVAQTSTDALAKAAGSVVQDVNAAAQVVGAAVYDKAKYLLDQLPAVILVIAVILAFRMSR